MRSHPNFKYELITDCPLDNKDNGESGNYYRIIRNETPKDEDFLPHYWQDSFKKRISNMKKNELCMSQGLSLLKDKADAENMAKRYKKMNAKAICKGYLDNKKGVLQKTPSNDWTSHHTFYAYKGINEPGLFKIEVVL